MTLITESHFPIKAQRAWKKKEKKIKGRVQETNLDVYFYVNQRLFTMGNQATSNEADHQVELFTQGLLGTPSVSYSFHMVLSSCSDSGYGANVYAGGPLLFPHLCHNNNVNLAPPPAPSHLSTTSCVDSPSRPLTAQFGWVYKKSWQLEREIEPQLYHWMSHSVMLETFDRVAKNRFQDSISISSLSPHHHSSPVLLSSLQVRLPHHCLFCIFTRYNVAILHSLLGLETREGLEVSERPIRRDCRFWYSVYVRREGVGYAKREWERASGPMGLSRVACTQGFIQGFQCSSSSFWKIKGVLLCVDEGFIDPREREGEREKGPGFQYIQPFFFNFYFSSLLFSLVEIQRPLDQVLQIISMKHKLIWVVVLVENDIWRFMPWKRTTTIGM